MAQLPVHLLALQRGLLQDSLLQPLLVGHPNVELPSAEQLEHWEGVWRVEHLERLGEIWVPRQRRGLLQVALPERLQLLLDALHQRQMTQIALTPML